MYNDNGQFRHTALMGATTSFAQIVLDDLSAQFEFYKSLTAIWAQSAKTLDCDANYRVADLYAVKAQKKAVLRQQIIDRVPSAINWLSAEIARKFYAE